MNAEFRFAKHVLRHLHCLVGCTPKPVSYAIQC